MGVEIESESLQIVLEKLKRITSLRQNRGRLESELSLLHANRAFLEESGKAVKDERDRLNAGIEKCDADIRDAIGVAHDFWSARCNSFVERAHSLSREFIVAPRSELKCLLQRAVEIMEAAENVAREVEAAKQKLLTDRSELVKESGEQYSAFPFPDIEAPLLLPKISMHAIASNSDAQMLKSIAIS